MTDRNKTRFAQKLGSRATKLTLGFAVVAGRSTKRFAQGVVEGAREAAAEYRSDSAEPTITADRDA